MIFFKYLSFLGISILVFGGCSSYKENKAIELKLAELEIGDVFSLDTMNTKCRWDRLYIVGPYQYFSVRKKANIPEIIKTITMREEHCVLVFMKENSMVNYSVISRSVADFIDFNGNGDPNDDHDAVSPDAVFILKEGREAVMKQD